MRLPKPFYRLPVRFDVERLRAEVAAMPATAWVSHPNDYAGNTSLRLISVDGAEATCTANMQGTHVLANASGGPMWTVGGRHVYQLQRNEGGWRISGLTFTLQWATGNMNVLTLAMAAGRS